MRKFQKYEKIGNKRGIRKIRENSTPPGEAHKKSSTKIGKIRFFQPKGEERREKQQMDEANKFGSE